MAKIRKSSCLKVHNDFHIQCPTIPREQRAILDFPTSTQVYLY